jgi:hypothetical protein
MPFSTGDLVRIKPLDNRLGRVVGTQASPRSGHVLYLVRYEVDPGPAQRSESSLYIERELEKPD